MAASGTVLSGISSLATLRAGEGDGAGAALARKCERQQAGAARQACRHKTPTSPPPQPSRRPHLLGVRMPLQSASLPLLALWQWPRPLSLLVEGEEAPSSTLGREAAQQGGAGGGVGR